MWRGTAITLSPLSSPPGLRLFLFSCPGWGGRWGTHRAKKCRPLPIWKSSGNRRLQRAPRKREVRAPRAERQSVPKSRQRPLGPWRTAAPTAPAIATRPSFNVLFPVTTTGGWWCARVAGPRRAVSQRVKGSSTGIDGCDHADLEEDFEQILERFLERGWSLSFWKLFLGEYVFRGLVNACNVTFFF